jgi:hypothetical protein
MSEGREETLRKRNVVCNRRDGRNFFLEERDLGKVEKEQKGGRQMEKS